MITHHGILYNNNNNGATNINSNSNNITIVIEKVIAIVIEGNLEVKLPTRWTDGKAEVGRVKEEKKRK